MICRRGEGMLKDHKIEINLSSTKKQKPPFDQLGIWKIFYRPYVYFGLHRRKRLA